MRYFIHLAYDGTSYCGWQVQNNGKTVQGELNFALSRLLSQPVSTGGCGRTDAGVHATDFYAHFDTDRILDEKFTFRLNSILPKDIQIFRVIPVHEKSNTRFDAVQRTYEYYLHFDKNPFLRHQSTQTYGDTLDWEKIYEATAMIPGFKDYTSLCRPSEDFKTNICEVTEARWDRVVRPAVAGGREYEFMRLTITSNRFLRGMIRKIVGVLLIIGRDKLSISEYKRIVEAKEEFPFGVSSPPQGLYLTQVVYKDGVLEGRAIDRSRKTELPQSEEEE